MANVTIDGLNELTAVAAADEIPIWDVSANGTRKISRTNYLANVFFTNVAQTVTTKTTFSAEVVFSRTAVSIASNALTAVGNCMVIDTEGEAATDNLDTINGGTTGQIMILNCASAVRAVTVRHNIGNIYLSGGANRALDHIRAHLTLICIGSEWRELSYSRNT